MFEEFGLTVASMQERINSSQNMGSQCCKFIKYDYQRRLRLSFDIPCTDEGGTDSSGETYSYSDGETSPGGSPDASPRRGYSSGSESERDVFSAFFDDHEPCDSNTIDLVKPLMKSSVLQKRSFPSRTGQGILVTAVLFLVLAGTVLTVDSYIWKVIRSPLAHYFLTVPFCIAAVGSAYFGTICVPLLERLKAHQVFRKEGPAAHLSKVGTPTMGGLYFVPIGVGVARLVTGSWLKELWGVSVATLAFAAIGFIDDWLALWRKHNYGMPGSLKFLLQVAVGVWFVFWLDNASLRSPYKMKRLVPLPAPFGLRYMGTWYIPLTVFCFAAMSNGVNLTDGLDGLAAGTSAAAYIGMAVAVLPIYPGLGIFGASMAGACIGFLTHNRHKARVFMGDTGSLALGGGLAAMAACTGMFLPLFIASGVFIIETVSVILQVSFFKLTKRFEGKGRRLLRMSPFHHHLELLGWKEPIIIVAAYVVAYILAIVAAHIGLISA
ncbi:hypothetical protein M758_4G130000 [Ceratodon purpureus]|nr:hypothetical protein M758_4G130000 [Ceratodon purpureus]